ncbi:MAG: putative major facilitator superfamily transporter [Ilumatobacteraceae bacterium]|nr:putative major facilitator superfamily transporter [Ilumatobacteraceae bacterium]
MTPIGAPVPDATPAAPAPRSTGGELPCSGGLDSARAWIVVAATFLTTFTVFGIVYSFGAFFTSMADDFGSGKGATALMFSITTAWYFSLGLVSGRIADRSGPRPVLLVGAVALGVGLLATSQVSSIWLGYATYGIGVGTAVACAYVPMVAMVGGWFVRRRTAALGVSVAGIGVGTLVVAPLSESLIDRYGWRTAYVVLAIGGSSLLLIASLGARRPPVGVHQRPASIRGVVRDRGFVVVYLANVLVSLALFVPFVFIKSYAEDHGIRSGTAATLVGVIGGASIVGRLGLGALASRLGSLRVMQASFAVMACSFVLWLLAGSSLEMLVLFAIVMGVGYGGFIALAPAVVATLYGTRDLGAILGALYTAAAIGGLIGPPVAGELIDRVSYSAAIVLAMALTAAATAVLLALSPTHTSSHSA